MKLPKYKSILSTVPARGYVLILIALGVTLLGLSLTGKGRPSQTGNARGSDDIVFAISFSPDGRTLAIARGASEPVRRFGRIELWDLETLKLRILIKGFDGPVRSISFSPDGQTLISGSTEFRSPKLQEKVSSREGSHFAELKWWDTRTGELKHKLTLPGRDSFSVRAIESPDGKQLALRESIFEPTRIVSFPIFGPLGATNIDFVIPRSVYWPGAFLKSEMKVADAHTGEVKSKLDADQAGAMSFSPDGTLLAIANGKEVKLWNAQTYKELRKLKDLKGTANAIAFSPDSRTLAVVSTRYEREYAKRTIKITGFSEVTLFDVSTGKISFKFKGIGAINTLAFTPDGRLLVAGGVLAADKGQVAGIKFVDAQTWKAVDFQTGADYKDAVDLVAFSNNGNWLAFRSGPGTVKLLDTQKWRVKQTWDADSVGDAVERPTSRYVLSVTRVLAVAFSADGLSVSGESDQGEIKSWDHRTGEVKRRLSIEEDDPSLVAVSSDGRSFAEISQGRLLLSDANNDAKQIVPLPDAQTVLGLALSADGQRLAVGNGREVILLSSTGEVTKKFSGPEGSVTRIAFSDNGRWLAGADDDGVIRIWNVASGQIEKTLMAHNKITALVFAPSGGTLATAGADSTISLWNVQTGLARGNFHKHVGAINALAFSPNGQLLASGGDDRTIVLWEVATGKSKHTFKGHDLTVASLAFSPDGQLLASGSGNASVVVWEVGSGNLSRVLK